MDHLKLKMADKKLKDSTDTEPDLNLTFLKDLIKLILAYGSQDETGVKLSFGERIQRDLDEMFKFESHLKRVSADLMFALTTLNQFFGIQIEIGRASCRKECRDRR